MLSDNNQVKRQFEQVVRAVVRRAEHRYALVRWQQLVLSKIQTPVIVYQMAKVGSQSIEISLRRHGIKPVYHTHIMNSANIDMFFPRIIEAWQIQFVQKRREKNIEICETYRSLLKRHRRVKFVTLVRDPIARNISLFFYRLGHYTGSSPQEVKLNVEDLMKVFLKKFKHSVPLEWFDTEMKPVTDIDVYQHPFPKNQGYAIINQGKFSLLVLKSESDDSTKEMALSKFFNTKDFHVVRANMADTKKYAQQYKSFTQDVRLPLSYIEAMYQSKYMHHFYTDEEIERLYAKWYRNALPE